MTTEIKAPQPAPASDPKCSTCAYRVFDRRAASVGTTMTMVCLHPKVGRADCAVTRIPADAKCGPDATLWQARAA